MYSVERQSVTGIAARSAIYGVRWSLPVLFDAS
jgi:hypothetical protein